MPSWEPPFWYGGREFQGEDLALIVATVRRFGGLGFAEVVATLCEILPWKAPNGQLKLVACAQLLQRLQAAGLVQLPVRPPARTRASSERMGTAPPNPMLEVPLAAIRPVGVEPVAAGQGPDWNAMMAGYHPLGYRRAFGAQQKYWIRGMAGGRAVVLGGLLFAAAAKALAARDAWIGWDLEQRRRYRHRILANGRYLLLPGVRVPHLASHALALALRRLGSDWRARYGYEPVLIETFVQRPWAGTCYRAANWCYLGETAGRGRQDRAHAKAQTVKAVWVYPLVADWRAALLAPLEVAADGEQDA